MNDKKKTSISYVLVVLFVLFQFFWFHVMFGDKSEALLENLPLSQTKFLEVPWVPQGDAEKLMSSLTKANLSTKLDFQGKNLLQNALTQEYFISVGEEITGTFAYNQSIQLFWLGEEGNIEEKIADNQNFYLLAVEEDTYQLLPMKLSTLPLLQLTADFLPVEKDDIKFPGTLEVFQAEQEETSLYSMEFKVRGLTSALFPKQSYKVDLLKEDGSRLASSLLNLRNDDDWNLTANYTDLSKIREASVFSLYEELATLSDTTNLQPQRGEFCELFINGEYWGIYQLTEPIDAQQMDLDESADFLYKTATWELPTTLELEEYQQSGAEHPLLEVKSWPEREEYLQYEGIIPFFTVLSQENTSIEDLSTLVNWDNLLDLYVMKSVLALNDNDIKNMVLIAEKQGDSYQIRHNYFDFNYAFGDINDSYSERATTDAVPQDLVLGGLVYNHLNPEAQQDFLRLYAQRYQYLRETVFNLENIKDNILLHYRQLRQSGAYERDQQAWDIEVDIDGEIERMFLFLEEHLQETDYFVSTLSGS